MAHRRFHRLLRDVAAAKVVAGLAMLTSAGALAQVSAADSRTAGLIGTYDGGQTEMAAGLDLQLDGRFRYGLSYGALDEEAEGTWTYDGRQVLLTSDPLTPPRFVFLDQEEGPAGQLGVGLDLSGGLSRQYFHVEIRLATGGVVDRQLSDEEQTVEIPAGEHPEAVTLVLPIYDLHSEAVRLSGEGGHQVRFRFEPNDLGKVAFVRTSLQNDHGSLVLARHDRAIRFQRVARGQPSQP